MVKFFQPKFHLLIGFGLLLIVACSQTSTTNSPEPTAQTTSSPTATTPATTAQTPATETAVKDHSAPNKGGQVVEVGKYHLELVALPETGGTHLDFYLLTGDNHQSIADAKVTAQVELPNGEQQTLDLSYDAQGGHYAVVLPGETPREYKVAMLTDIQGEKVNGRFNFKR